MGKGGGPLSVWLKEFTALVFTQTIQAFVYAMVISIILYGMSSKGNITADDNNSALGLMATFALLSVFKVEELSKKIFGVGDTKASHKNAMKSIAKTAIAAKLGGRVLNNTGKFFGGVKAIGQAGQDRKKAKKRLTEDMKDNGFDEKGNYIGKGKISGTNGTSGSSSASSTAGMSAAQKKYYDAAKAAKANGDMDGYHKNMEFASLARTMEGGSSGGSAAGSSSGGADVSDAAKRRMKNALRTYEDKLSEINKARDEGWKNIASSIEESAGALVLGTAGGILGGADGDIDEMLQGIMAGAGAGDIIGKNVINGLDKSVNFLKRQAKREAGVSSKELKRTISMYKDSIENLNVQYGVNDVSDI